MYQTNLALKNENESSVIPEWDYFVSEISKVFRFTEEETKWLKNCKTAQLIASIPFEAECISEKRSSFFEKCLYLKTDPD